MTTITLRKPILRVKGPKTANLLDVWGDTLVAVQIHDATEHDSDSCTLTFRVAPPFPPMPPKGTRYEVSVGWEETAQAKTGVYTVQRSELKGDPESGCEMIVTCRAAGLDDAAKSVDSRHWDNRNVGAIVGDVAKAAGLTAVIDPELAAIVLPYRARIGQEVMDFLSDLAEDVGGAVKIAGEKVVVTKRGSGRSASGKTLPTLTVDFTQVYEFSFEFEARADDAECATTWWDEAKGAWVSETDKGAGKGRTRRPQPAASKAEAKRAAKARRKAKQRQSATGHLQLAGDPTAVAGCPVKVTGFGPNADDTPFVAEAIDHDIVPDSGWIMSVDLETKDKKES